MIQTVKNNEQARQEYRLLSTFEMDIKDKAEYRVKRETAKLMKQRGYPISEILLMTGLPELKLKSCNFLYLKVNLRISNEIGLCFYKLQIAYRVKVKGFLPLDFYIK